MAANSTQSNRSYSVWPVLGVLGTIVVFAILVFLAYGLGNNAKPVAATANQFPSGASLKAKDAEVLTSYGWVNQEAGVVHIPVDRAKDLVVEELNQ